ncbi:LexA family transcriptional regulator [uncultured Fusobacterium sp.]|uniref:helix-turn-helix domain-containing protein n=1 Tax=uncultured Fusobacterium sp. TaxID=159267 RepID=UPI0025914076|nr:LexA family transcriptional regulator [uncultured Fusobacterium sp.]
MNEKEMNNVVKFLREERDKRKISQGQLSYKSGISVSIISKIEQGLRNPTVNTVLSMGKALGIDTILLLEKMNVVTKNEIDLHVQEKVAEKLRENLEYIQEQNEDTKIIPIYNSASAGVGRIAESIPDDYLSLPMKYIENTVGIKINGDSMYPTITDGAIVILKKDTEVYNGEIGVFLLNDEAYVKRITRKDDFIFLYSDNMIYQPIVITEKDNFIICGKVIKTINKL